MARSYSKEIILLYVSLNIQKYIQLQVFNFRPWCRAKYFKPEKGGVGFLRETGNHLQEVIIQKTVVDNFSAVRTSNLIKASDRIIYIFSRTSLLHFESF